MTEFEEFKLHIGDYGKELDLRFSIDDTEYTSENIVSLNPHYEGALYSSVMRQLDLELLGEYDFKGKTVKDIKFGVSAGNKYAYINKDDYIVKECEYDVANNTTKCECYDDMLSSMVPYDISPLYPITLGEFLQAICDRFSWTLGTAEFVNSAAELESEKFDSTYTFRDVLDQIAQAAAGIIAFKDKKLCVIYPQDSGEIIDESNLKSLTIGEKYGPVNSLVLARTPQEDNIYRQDSESVEANGLTEVKIENNQIIDNNREAFIDNIFNQINGTEFYLYELESFGIGYLDLGDIFTLQREDGTEYQTLMLIDDLQITQGLNEKSSFVYPEETTETDYSAASKSDRLLNQTILKVNKQEQTISALASRTEKAEDGLESLTKSVEAVITPEEVEVKIKEAIGEMPETDSVTTSTGFTFNKDGLKISKDESDMSTLIDEDGMDVSCGDEKVLTADSTGVNALNLTSRQYLTVGKNSRFEDYDNGTDSQRTGCFFIGGG